MKETIQTLAVKTFKALRCNGVVRIDFMIDCDTDQVYVNEAVSYTHLDVYKRQELGFAVDVFPHYGSDVGAAIRGGHNIRGALIGQGVHASHGTERTHVRGLEQTLRLIEGYIGM